MKVFVTGVGGQLGHDVVNNLIARGHEAIGSDIKVINSGVQDGSAVTAAPYVCLDITDRAAVQSTIEQIHPDAIIHCAAWTTVDAAEDEEKKPLVHRINVEGTKNIADAAKSVDTKIVYLSTDYVFDGQGERPWQPDDKNYAPLNYYGQTKLVRVIKGTVYDVAVDLRPGSPTFGKHYGVILTEDNRKQYLIPSGFAHGFLVLSDVAEFCYKCDDFYHENDEGGLAWNDPEIGIEWPEVVGEYKGRAAADGYTLADGSPLILSEKDQNWQGISESFKVK